MKNLLCSLGFIVATVIGSSGLGETGLYSEDFTGGARLGDGVSSPQELLTASGELGVLADCLVHQSLESTDSNALDGSETSETETDQEKADSSRGKSGKVTGIKYNCVHVMKLEKTLKLYREILGFKMDGASVLHGSGIEGMLVMELKAGDCKIFLSLPAPDGFGLEPIGNTNHNHFMLLVDNIVPICDKLKAEGYELENDNYARDKYSFFTGPNGEIIGLTEYK